jgi:integrase
VRATLARFTAVVQSFVDQGVLPPRNPIALVEPPAVKRTPPQSWTLAEVQTFRESAREDRLYACWLLSCYGLRRSEVLGVRWSDVDGETLHIRQGRVALGSASVVDDPKSHRSLRALPLPAEVAEALRALRMRPRSEALALGVGWSDDRLVAVDEAGTPLRPEAYSDAFQRLRERAELRRIKLHALRNTSVSLMLNQRKPVHVVAGWHGHDPAVSLSIYADAKADEMRAAGASLFG